jgi:putative transposase
MERKDPLIEGELYHIFNRGVEKRVVFKSQLDFRRFYESLAQFNTSSAVLHSRTKFIASDQKSASYVEVGPRHRRKEKKLVSILAYTLLPNHFHLLLRQEEPGGITEFMRKIGTGYTMYFNKKHERVGPLFQGKFKSVLVARDEYFQYIPHYIHLNVLDTTHAGWKNDGISVEQAYDALRKYRWSSAKEYIGVNEPESILAHSAIKEIFGEDLLNKNTLKELLEEDISL